MVESGTSRMEFPGSMLRRGFWIYVWRVSSPSGELLYVGRTGDNSSPNAVAPYSRMGQHLGFVKAQNALRKHLLNRNVDPETCAKFELIAHGPIFPEITKSSGADRQQLMAQHLPLRNLVGAMEKALAHDLSVAQYTVLNVVKWSHPYDPKVWQSVRAAFAEHFPKLNTKSLG